MSNNKRAQVVASRELTDEKDPKRRIVVSLGMPRQVSPLGWECDVYIDGLGVKPIVDYGYGVDSLMALLQGVEVLRLSLKRSPYRLSWLGNSTLYPNGGLPQQVGGDLGEEFDERIEQLVKREEKPFWNAKLKYLRDRRLEYLRTQRLERKQVKHSAERLSSKGRAGSD